MLLCNPEHKVSGVEGGQAHAGAPPPRRMKAHEVHCDEAQRTNGMTQLGNTGRASSPAATEGCDKDGKGAAPLGGAHHHMVAPSSSINFLWDGRRASYLMLCLICLAVYFLKTTEHVCGCNFTKLPLGMAAERRWITSPSLRCMFSIIQ